MTVVAGTWFALQYDDIITVTHGSGITLPGAANFTTEAGTRMLCVATATDTVDVLLIFNPDGTPVAGSGIGQHTIYVDAGSMKGIDTSGAAAGSYELGANPNANHFESMDFDTSADEYAQFKVQMPKSWDEGTLIAQVVWSHPATATNFGVSFFLEARAYSNNDAGNANCGTAREMQDTGGTTDDIYLSPESAAITVAGSPGAEELVLFQLYRDVSDGGDTLAVDARILGLKIHYTTDAGTDD